MDEYLWNALYMQNPTPEGGGMLKRHRWRYWQYPNQQLAPVAVVNERCEVIEIVAEELPASFSRHIQSWDLAFKGKETSDFVAGLDIGVSGANATSSIRFTPGWTSPRRLRRSSGSGRRILDVQAPSSNAQPTVRQLSPL